MFSLLKRVMSNDSFGNNCIQIRFGFFEGAMMEGCAVRFCTQITHLVFPPVARAGRVALMALLVASSVLALEPPTQAQLEQLRQDPDAFLRLQQRAMRYGNHKISPSLLQHAKEKMASLAKGEDPSLIPPPAWRGMPTTGTNNILVFLIDFPDEPHVNSLATITNKLFGAGLPADFPLESLANFYKRSSYGQLTINGSTLGWYTMAHNRSWYTNEYGDGNYANYQIIKEVADHFDDSIDYSQFDNNGDGKIDYFAVLWAGPSGPWASFWWGYQWDLYTDLTLDGVQFYSFSWQWESNPSYTGSAEFKPNVVIHETGHALGLPDYYDYESGLGPEGGVGGMDMMDANTGDHNCFSKFILDWITPTVVTGSLTGFAQRHSADYPEAVALARNYTGADPFDEFFMVQNRQKVNNDKNLPNAGLVVWHVDARLNGGGTDYQYNNSYTSHKLLRLMEADGLEQIEAGGSANAGDFYVAGREFTPESTPNSALYSGASSEVRVTAIYASNQVMVADYSALDNFPVIDPVPVSVIEGASSIANVTLLQPPTDTAMVTISYLSGSSNLYVDGESVLTFTPDDWDIPQAVTIAAALDADMTNDVAVFQASAAGGGVRSTTFVAEQYDTGDFIPPHCSFSASVNADRTLVTVDFLFDEKVMDFDMGDIWTSDNISGGFFLYDAPVDVGGSNTLFRAVFETGSPLGTFTITIPAYSLTDQSGNFNPNEEYSFTYTLPWVKTDFQDDMEHGVGGWTTSTQDMAVAQTKVWELGVPDYVNGPAAYSGANCWGTILTNDYPNNMNGWLMSPPIQVGDNPTLEYYVWLDLESGYDYGYVEVFDGHAWVNVLPYNFYTGDTAGSWVRQQIALDNAAFGNRIIKVRFRATSDVIIPAAGMYVDDVTVRSEREPGLWLVSCSPAHAPAGTNTPVAFTLYNSLTVPAAASADISSPDFGVSVASGSPVSYGFVAPGTVAGSLSPVTLQLDAAGNFDSARITLFHQARNGGVAQPAEAVEFTVDGVSNSVSTNVLTVKSMLGVTNWMGAFLTGNGGPTSAIFQVIHAGTDGLKNAPRANGQVTGDDKVLYSADVHLPYGRIGEGSGILPDAGSFMKSFSQNLGAGARVYVRAWNASSFEGALAYGDSELYVLSGATNQTHDFGRWGVTTPLAAGFFRDSNGDSVPDGWCVLNGRDVYQPIVPLGIKVTSARAATDFSYPNRVAVSSNFVFVADTENSRIQVWDRALTNRLFMLGGGSDTNFSKPRGVAVSRDGVRLAVADTARQRVRVFAVNPTNGVLSALATFGSYGTETSQFNDPIAVAFGLAGELYVADSQQSGTCNNRVQVFNADYSFNQQFGIAGSLEGQFNRLLGIGMGGDGTLFAADGANHRVQSFVAGATYAGKLGVYGTAPGQFNRVWDAQPGVGGLLYAADLYNKRIQVLDVSNPYSIKAVGVYSNAGALGAFNLPQSAAPAPDANVLYVADTYNSRVLRLEVTMDSDGDGLDDVWEVLHGLNPNDPNDALADADGDGVLNIGEFRIGLDPQSGNTDGDGAGDAWELANGLNPLVSNAVPANIPAMRIAVSPAPVVRSGQAMLILATFSQAITNAPTLTLSGAVSVGPVLMSGSGTNWSYPYVVPSAVDGAVNGVVAGAIGSTGLLSDPPVISSNPLFTIFEDQLRISAITTPAGYLAWNAWSGDVFQIQASTNLLSTNWSQGVMVTSAYSGTLVVSNVFGATNRVEYLRVLRRNAP